ncbi:transmembrane protein, putative [Medicago truncatula]|uniref:Transmembrane protein, putative n=1 Tax=Medicago truncatula TaxID=3880 RepID=A0A072ULS6_MEDTR|nr:transmembrane protein, putative [Medicago truncatula]
MAFHGNWFWDARSAIYAIHDIGGFAVYLICVGVATCFCDEVVWRYLVVVMRGGEAMVVVGMRGGGEAGWWCLGSFGGCVPVVMSLFLLMCSSFAPPLIMSSVLLIMCWFPVGRLLLLRDRESWIGGREVVEAACSFVFASVEVFVLGGDVF